MYEGWYGLWGVSEMVFVVILSGKFVVIDFVKFVFGFVDKIILFCSFWEFFRKWCKKKDDEFRI